MVTVSSETVSVSVSDNSVVAITESYSRPVSFTIGQTTSSPSAPTLGGIGLGTGSSTTNTTNAAAAIGRDKPREMAWMLSTKSSGSITIAGGVAVNQYLSILWWDGQVQVVGPGNGSTLLSASRAVPATGNWSGASPKEIYVWSGNRIQSGGLTALQCPSGGLVAIDVADCESMLSLDCSNNSLRSLDLSKTGSLQYVYCGSNSISSLNAASLLSLKELYCHSNLLTALSLSSSVQLESLQANNNQISTFSLTGMPKLVNFYFHYNLISFIDLRSSPMLKNVNLIGNFLTSIRATGLVLNGNLGTSLGQNMLSAAALNTFYQDLSPATGGAIYVTGNPGAASDDTSIAVAKGYAVYG